MRVRIDVGLAVVLVVLAGSTQLAVAQDEPAATASPSAEQPPAPDLADLIPLSSALSLRLADLQKAVAKSADLGDVEDRLLQLAARVDGDAERFAVLKASSDARVGQLAELRADIDAAGDALEALEREVAGRVRSLAGQRAEWQAQQAKWSAWQAGLDKQEVEEIGATVGRAQQAIATALGVIRQQLKPQLDVQERIGALQNRVASLTAEIAASISVVQGGAAADAAPPMLSSAYAAQLGAAFQSGARGGLLQTTWPAPTFLAEHGWVAVVQAALSIILALVLVRQRSKLEEVEHWRFVARRPIAAALLIGIVTPVAFYGHLPDVLRFVLSFAVVIAFLRLMGTLIDDGWRRQFLHGLGGLVLVTNFFYGFGLTPAVFRLYVLVASTASAVACLRWAQQSRARAEASAYVWVLRLLALFLATIAVAELRGNAKIAEFLFVTSLRTIAIVFVFGLLRQIVRGGVEWAVTIAAARGTRFIASRTEAVVSRVGVVLDALIGVAILSLLLMTWQVYQTPAAAVSGLLATKVALGSQEITIGLVLLAGGSLAASYLASGVLQTLLTSNVMARRNVDTGVSIAVNRLLHYALITAGFVIALGVLGVDLTKIVLLVSALGVGIGFGLQTIVNNFVCGLILLFERPLRVGDTIELGGRWAKIAKIGLRSTTVRTLDQADIIVPNTDLVSNQVTNWTLTDRHARATIFVKVALGSDVAQVTQALKDCALAHPGVMKHPEPWIHLRGFGGGSLHLELNVWIVDVDTRLSVESDLYRAIEERFRQLEVGILS